jgi:ABC-type antimicrobial peptide transport system permease subunit
MDNFWNQDKWATVIGVVGDIRQEDLTAPPVPVAYFPYEQRPSRTWSMTIVARPDRGDAASLGPAIRDVVRGVDSDVPVTFSTIESRIAGTLVPRRFTMLILALFAASALALACVGIWGVVAYAVARRTREIGIRIALGADPASVRRLVQRSYLRAAAIGTSAGLLLALGLTRLMRSLLYDVEPTDPLTIAGVITVLAAAAWLASWLPARRTAAISPVETMKLE